jgi:thioredoxin 2
MTETTTTSDAKHLMLRCHFCDTWNRVDVARAADRPKCGKCARFILLDRPFILNAETFDRTIAESDAPVFVDFWAEWCAPCKMMAPAVDELATNYHGRALIAKLDTDRAPEISARLTIRSIPTSIVFNRGAEVVRQTGALPKAALEALLARVVK